MSGHAEADITRVPCGAGVFGRLMTQKRNPVRNARCLTAYKATGAAVACKLALAPIRLNTSGPGEGLSATQGSAEARLDCATFFSQTQREATTGRHATQRHADSSQAGQSRAMTCHNSLCSKFLLNLAALVTASLPQSKEKYVGSTRRCSNPSLGSGQVRGLIHNATTCQLADAYRRFQFLFRMQTI